MLPDLMEGKQVQAINDVTAALLGLGPAIQLYGALTTLLILLHRLPATSATAKRSFSCLRRLKTYPSTTMGQERLNSDMILHVHQTETDDLDLKEVAKELYL
jgi:hypothetical protein